jgi:hypothetical protein
MSILVLNRTCTLCARFAIACLLVKTQVIVTTKSAYGSDRIRLLPMSWGEGCERETQTDGDEAREAHLVPPAKVARIIPS